MSILLMFVINIIIDNPYTHKVIKELINEKLEANTNIKVSFEALSLQAFPPGIELYGVKIRHAHATENENMINSAYVSTRVSLYSLFISKPKLSFVKFKNVKFSLPNADLGPILKESTDSKPNDSDTIIAWPPKLIEIPLEEIIIENATFAMNNKINDKETFSTSIEGANFDVKINDLLNIDFESDIGNFSLLYNNKPLVDSARIDMSGAFTNDQFSIPHFKLDGLQHQLNFSTSGRLDTENNSLKALKIISEIDGTGNLTALGSYLEIEDTDGNVDIKGKMTFNIPFEIEKKFDFKLESKAKVHNGRIYAYNLYDSESDLEISLDKLSLINTKLIKNELVLAETNGEIHFNESVNYNFDIHPIKLDLTTLLSALNVDFSTVNFDINTNQLILKGSALPFKMEIQSKASLANLRFHDIEKYHSKRDNLNCNGYIQLEIDADKLDLKAPTLNCVGKNKINSESFAKSDLSINGLIHFNKNGLDLKLKSTSIDLGIAEAITGLKFQGTGTVNTRIYGPYEKILIDNDIKIWDAHYNELNIKSGNASVLVEGKKINWKNIDLETFELGSFQSNFGNYDLDSSRFLIDFYLKNFSGNEIKTLIQAFSPKLDLEFDIKEISGTVKGAFKESEELIGSVNGEINLFRYNSENLFDNLKFEIESNEKHLFIPKFDLKFGNLILAANSMISKQIHTGNDSYFGINNKDQITVNFKSDRNRTNPFSKDYISLQNHLNSIPYLKNYIAPIKLSAMIDVEGRLEGNIDNIQGYFKGKFHDLSILGSQLAPLEYQGIVNNSTIDLTFDQAGKALKGRLSANIAKPSIPFEWYLSLNQFDIRPFASEFFFNNPRNFIYLTGNWNLRGNFANWWDSTGEINLDDLLLKYHIPNSVKQHSLSLKLAEKRKISLNSKGWLIENNEVIRILGDDVSIDIDLKNNQPPEKLNINVISTLSLALLNKISNQFESTSGSIKSNIQIQGSISEIKPTITIKSPENISQEDKPSIGFSSMRPPFKGIEVDILFKDNIIQVNRFIAEKGGGKLNIYGKLNFNDPNDSNITVEANELGFAIAVPVVKNVDAKLNGTLNITGNQPPFNLRGDLNISKASATRDFDIRDQFVELIKNKSITSEINDQKPLLNLDVNLEANNSIDIVNNNMNINIGTRIRILGNNVTPVILGQAEINEGTFNYKQNFNIQRGLITFEDPIRPDPTLDILASSDVSSYRVFINISGKASNPIVDFSVDPPTREDGTPISNVDIILLLARGNLPQEKNISEAGGAVTAEAATIIVGQFEQPLENLFDLSNQSIIRPFYVDFYASEGGAPTPRGNIPIHLGKDTDLVFSADSQYGSVSVEYPLHEGISVSGKYKQSISNSNTEADTQTDTGVDLKFKFSFP